MTFLQKLTKDTIAGNWDDTWNYKDGSKTFSFIKTKHYLSGLTLGFSSKDLEIIFPNGYGVLCKKEELESLRDAILNAMDRRVNKCVGDYLANVDIISETDEKDAVGDNDTKDSEMQ